MNSDISSKFGSAAAEVAHDIIVVYLSGGKDSTATLLLALDQYPRESDSGV